MTNPHHGVDEHAMTFTRDQARDAEECSSRTAPEPPVSGGPCRARRDDGDPVGRDAIPLDRGGRSPARAKDATKPWQHSSLEPDGPLRLVPGEARLLSQRVVDEGDEPQAMSLPCDHLFETVKGKAVHDHDRPVGKCGNRRTIRPRRKLDHPYRARPGDQILDNVTVVEISAGELVEATRDDEYQFGHPSGAS